MNKNTNIKERRVLNIPKESFNTIKEYCNSNSLDMIQWLTNNSLEKINSSLVRKWKLTGLLQFLTPEKEIECAILLEKTGNIIIQNNGENPSDYQQMVAGTLIPICRRLYHPDVKISLIPTAEWLYSDYIKWLDSKPIVDSTIKEEDKETELCSMYVKKLETQFI
jgi:hypothetical protein